MYGVGKGQEEEAQSDPLAVFCVTHTSLDLKKLISALLNFCQGSLELFSDLRGLFEVEEGE